MENSPQHSIVKHKTAHDVNHYDVQSDVEAEVLAHPAKMFDILGSNILTPKSTSILSFELRQQDESKAITMQT